MSRVRPVGLIGAGSVANSRFAGLPGFLEHLGPVKSVSTRVASRIANALKTGRAIDRYEQLAECRLIFVIVPDQQVRDLVSGLAVASLRWIGKTIVLCDTWLDSGELTPLERLGAETASVCALDASPDARFLLEGTKAAVTETRRILRGGARLFVIAPLAKPLMHAALTFSESLLFPLLSAADRCLKLAEVPPLQASAFLEAAALRTARSYGKSGRKAWNGALPESETQLLRRQIEVLAATNPGLALFLVEQCARSLEYFGRDADWLWEAASAVTTRPNRQI